MRKKKKEEEDKKKKKEEAGTSPTTQANSSKKTSQKTEKKWHKSTIWHTTVRLSHIHVHTELCKRIKKKRKKMAKKVGSLHRLDFASQKEMERNASEGWKKVQTDQNVCKSRYSGAKLSHRRPSRDCSPRWHLSVPAYGDHWTQKHGIYNMAGRGSPKNKCTNNSARINKNKTKYIKIYRIRQRKRTSLQSVHGRAAGEKKIKKNYKKRRASKAKIIHETIQWLKRGGHRSRHRAGRR